MSSAPQNSPQSVWQRRMKILASLPSDPKRREQVARRLKRAGKSAVQDLRQGKLPRRSRHLKSGSGVSVRIPPAEPQTGPINRPELTVAVILDPFSDLAWKYEWNQVKLTKKQWRTEVQAHTFDLLFVESAWRGNDGSWNSAMKESGPSDELRELVEWFKDQQIPTVFWNKEDPPNYDRFIATAKLFDQVFTVDADKIPDYERDLGHDRVGLLPFAAQPRIHNPIRRGPRWVGKPYDVAFAGTYFRDKHPDRRAQMDILLPAGKEQNMHIYSRMQNLDERYQFPSEYQSSIVGTLPYEEMVGAYPLYNVFLNVNSVTKSPTMCSRRLFEISAAQTAILSTPAAAIDRFFGDTISVAKDTDEAKLRLKNLIDHKELRDRQALRAHRVVFENNLYTHRANEVLESVGLPSTTLDRSVSVIVPTMRPDQLENVWDFVSRQVTDNVELVLLPHGFEPDADRIAALNATYGLDNVVIRPVPSDALLGGMMNLGVEAASGDYIAKMDDDNYYGAHFLSDLLYAFDFSEAQVVGKWAHYVHIGDETGPTLLRFPAAENRYVDLVQGGTIITPREVAAEVTFENLPRRVDTTFLDKIRDAGGKVYSGDRFNFVSKRSLDAGSHTWTISTEEVLSRKSTLVFYGDATHHVTV